MSPSLQVTETFQETTGLRQKQPFLTETSHFSAGLCHFVCGNHCPSAKGIFLHIFRVQGTKTARTPAIFFAKGKYPQRFRAQGTKTVRRPAVCSVRGKYAPLFAVHGTSYSDDVEQKTDIAQQRSRAVGNTLHRGGTEQRTDGSVQRRSGGPMRIVMHRIGL